MTLSEFEYYRTENGVLYCGDAADVLTPGMADLIVTSPPYDNLRRYGGHRFDFKKFRQLAPLLYDSLKPGGVMVWVVCDETKNGNESGTSFLQAMTFKSIGFNLHDTMFYQKNGPSYPSKNSYYHVMEYMFVFSKGNPKTFNPLKDRLNKWYGQKWSKKRSRRQFNGELKDAVWGVEEGGKYGTRFNVWKYQTGAHYSTKDIEAFEHPAIFPEQLAQDHILSWSNEGDTVMDTMAGSGTTVKMAERLKRKWIAIEIEQSYADIIKQRIENERKQRKLF